MDNNQNRCVLGAVAAIVCSAMFVAGVQAQGVPDRRDYPLDTRPLLPPFEPPATDDAPILPVIPLPKTPDTQGLLAGQGVFVNEFRVTGNTAVADHVLMELAQPYVGRPVTFAELAALRDELTRAYIAQGYINSGAVIPPQTVEDGVIEIEIIEGHLAQIEYQSDGRLRESYVRRRLERGVATPLNVYQLEQRLQHLQQDRRIQSVQAALVPTDERGKSNLRLQVSEEKSFRLALQLDNYESPSVGAEAIRLSLAHANLSGFGDRLEAGYDRSEGLWSARARYEVPLNARDTLFDVHVTHSESEVIEEPFDEVDIESESSTYGFTLSHPLVDALRRSSRISITGELRRSESFLLGEPSEFSEGAEDGVSKVTVVRLGWDWSQRSRSQVFAARTLLSLGIDALNPTVHPDDVPDSQFAALLLQAQWARRLQWWDAQLFARGDAQVTNSPLLGLEQFAIGGHATVRGYRENTLVRDQGWVVSVEGRVPVWRRRASRLEVGLFADAGRAWNKERDTLGQKNLSSGGVTLHYTLNSHFNVQLDWAERFENVPDGPEYDLQDDGLHVRLSAMY